MANKKTDTQRSVVKAVTQMPFEKAVEEIAKMPMTKAAYEMGKLAGKQQNA